VRTVQNFQAPHTADTLLDYLAQTSLSLAICWTVTPNFGPAVAGTSWSTSLSGLPGYASIVFDSNTGIVPSKIVTSDGIHAPDIEVDILFNDQGFTEADILAGRWFGAVVELFYTNPDDLTMGQILLPPSGGRIAEIISLGSMARITVRGINHSLNSQFGRLVRTECDANLGDARCGVDMVPFTHAGNLTAVTSVSVFQDSSRTETSDYFVNGLFTFTSGPNNGMTFEIELWDAATKKFTLRTPAPYLPAIGNTYSAKRGCRKRFQEDCVTKFNNALRFRGFPDVPGIEEVQRLP